MTQVEKLRTHLKNGGKVTSFYATLEMGITQLATRITELEAEDGITLKRKWVEKGDKKFIEYSWPSWKEGQKVKIKDSELKGNIRILTKAGAWVAYHFPNDKLTPGFHKFCNLEEV